MNFLGLVAGLDLRNPGVKLPGFGRIGLPQQTGDRRAGAIAIRFTANCTAAEVTAPRCLCADCRHARDLAAA